MTHNVKIGEGRIFKISELGKAEGNMGEYMLDNNEYYVFIEYVGSEGATIAAFPRYFSTLNDALDSYNNVEGANNKALPGIVFYNKTVKGGLNITKEVTGTDKNDKDFKFELHVWNDEPDNTNPNNPSYAYTGAISGTKGGVAWAVSDSDKSTGTFTEGGKTYDTTKITFTLKAGETLTIDSLPVNTHYAITELDDDMPVGYTYTKATRTQGGNTETVTEPDKTISGVIPESSVGSVTVAFTNKYEAKGVADVNVVKNLIGKDMVEGQFSFTLEPVRDAPLLDAEGNTVKELTATNEDAEMADGTSVSEISFPALNFFQDENRKHAGNSYIYKITENEIDETIAENENIVKVIGETHPENIYVRVTISDKGDGTMDSTVEYFQDPDCKQSLNAAEFTNAYEKLGKLEITKKINKGTAIDKEATGTFYYAVYKASDVEEGKPKDGSTAVRTGSIIVNADGNGIGKKTENDLPYGDYYVYELTGENGTPITDGSAKIIDSKVYTVSGFTDSVAVGETDGKVTLVNTHELKEASVSKWWMDGTYKEWPSDVESITLELTRWKDKTKDGNFGITLTASNNNGTYSVVLNPDLEGVKATITPSEEVYSHYVITVNGLDKYYSDGTELGEYSYYFSETNVVGPSYREPEYKAIDNGSPKTPIEGSKVLGDGKHAIVNTPSDAVCLPAAGGPGTTIFTILGMILIATAGILLLRRKRNGVMGL